MRTNTRKKKLLAVLLAAVMVLGLMPLAAQPAAATGVTLKYLETDTNVNASWYFNFASADPDFPIDQVPMDYSAGSEVDVSSYGCTLFDAVLVSYDTDNYSFLGWKINDVEYYESSAIQDQTLIEDIGADWQEPSGAYLPYNGRYYPNNIWVGNNVLTLFGTVKSSIVIEPVFAQKQSVAFTPTVEVAAGQSALGTVTAEYINGDATYSTWTVTATPAAGYELAYIENGAGTKYYSENGTSVTWDVTASETWTAYFEDVMARFISMSFGSASSSGVSVSGGTAFVGQRAGVSCEWNTPTNIPESVTAIHYALYAGDSASGTPLATKTVESFNRSAGSVKGATLMVDPMPAGITALTLTVQLGDGAVKAKTIPVTVNASGSTDLVYMDVPGNGPIYGNSAGGSGAAVYDAAAYTDPVTGAMTLYLGTSGGVAVGSGGAFTALGDLTGDIIALGTDAAGNLTAVKAELTYNDSTDDKYSIYTYTDEGWSSSDTAGHSISNTSSLRVGLVMGPSDVWVQDAHWNGSAWVSHDYGFNSFWKADAATAYAGSANGLYKYSGGEWTLLSGVTGTRYITSGCQSGSGITLTVSDFYDPHNRHRINNSVGSVWQVSVNGTSANAEYVDQGGIFIGIAADGSLYAITQGRFYENETNTGYRGSYLYKYVNGARQYQVVAAFNDPDLEDGDPTTKYRPEAITFIVNPDPKVTLFLGGDGEAYALFGSSSISFVSNGGSAVAPITQAICSAVTAPASPTREGYTFVGWYSLENFMTNGPSYAWSVMPGKDITLYAKWAENGSGDPFATERAKAQESLDTALALLDQGDYEASVWAEIQAAYDSGTAAIAAADSYDGVYAALNSAVGAINALAQNVSGEITVAVTVEKLTVDGTYLIEPTLLTVNKYEKASVVITELLSDFYSDSYEGTPYTMTGNVQSGFYLSGIYDPTYVPGEAGNNGLNIAGEEFIQNNEDFLSEKDGGTDSGWMYCVNGSFPGVGADAWLLKNGDVMRWQYTCTGLGADIGADNTAWGSGAGVPVADKDALIRRVAEIRAAEEEAVYGAAYGDALTVLRTIEASQAEVDAALAALEPAAQVVAPEPVSGLTAGSENGTVSLSWTAPAGAETYRIARQAYGSSTWEMLATAFAGTEYTDSSAALEVGTRYRYAVAAVNGAGKSAAVCSAYVTVVAVAKPGPVSGLTADSENSTMTVRWTASDGAETYRIARQIYGGSWQILAAAFDGTEFVDDDADLIAGARYRYAVAAVNDAGKSAAVSTAYVTFADVAKPGPVSGVQAASESGTVTVSWTAPAGAESFRIARMAYGESWVMLETAFAGTEYTDSSAALEVGTRYRYAVAAVNAAGKSVAVLSPYVTVVDVAKPGPVSGLTASAEGGTVTVSWTAPAGAASYRIARQAYGGSWELLETAFNGTSYVDNNAAAGNRYRYAVSAVNAAGKSAAVSTAYVTAD